MRIEHEIPDVTVVRHPTVAKALANIGKRSSGKMALILNTLHLGTPIEEDQELSFVLHEPLWAEHEGAAIYTRTLAFAFPEVEMRVPEFYRSLDERGYYPASLSEGLSYLSFLGNRDVKTSAVIHLGTFLRGTHGEERRFVTKDDGRIETIPFFSQTKLKSYYAIVAVKKEKVVK